MEPATLSPGLLGEPTSHPSTCTRPHTWTATATTTFIALRGVDDEDVFVHKLFKVMVRLD